MELRQNPDLFIQLILLCVGVAAFAMTAALYFTRKSKKDAKKDIRLGLEELYTVSERSFARMEEIDSTYADSVGTLSPAATQNFSLAKQFTGLMERRAETVEELMRTRRLEDLFKAHKIITSPLENSGDHLSSLVFSSTVLQINPGDFELALDTMITSVERELGEGKKASSYIAETYNSGRRRKFTIRGFIKSVTGEAS